jgi:hypothetical protein
MMTLPSSCFVASSPVPSPTTPQRPLGHAARPHPIRKLNRRSGLTNPLRIDPVVFDRVGRAAVGVVAGRGVEEYTSRPEKGLFDHQAEITAIRVVHRS